MDGENKKAFPPGSIISGFRRQKNIGEIIAPSKLVRTAQQAPAGGRGCFPCNAPSSCILHEAGTLQRVSSIQSSYDGVVHRISKHLECTTPNLVYHIRCVCVSGASYVGSTVDMKRRWTKHKYDIRNDNWTSCVLARHFGHYHRLDRDTHISKLEVTLVDSCQEEKDLKKLEDRWICNLGTLFGGGGLNKRNEVLSHRRRNFGGSWVPHWSKENFFWGIIFQNNINNILSLWYRSLALTSVFKLICVCYALMKVIWTENLENI